MKLVVSRVGWAERLVARLSGADVTGAGLAGGATEASLAKFPPEFWNESQEANVFVLERLKDASWRRALARGAARGADVAKLDTRVAQHFVLTTGRRLAMLRLCLGAVEARPLAIVSDLPRPVLRAFAAEAGEGVTFDSAWARPLRAAAAVHDLAYLIARHVVRMVRLARLWALPRRPRAAAPYVAWVNAMPAEVQHDHAGKASLPGLLAEARGDRRCDIVIQGAAPAVLPDGFLHRDAVPAVRYRPPFAALARAVARQGAQMLSDIAHAADFPHRTLVATATFDLPALRCWFEADRPEAVLYPNHSIGNELPVALLDGAPPSMMVFYSANVSYRPVPRVSRHAGLPTSVEPEIRFIIADRLTMWSPDMTAAFRSAGYAPERLVETGPVVFARAAAFAPSSRYLRAGESAARGNEPVRIGVFEVTPVSTRMRFEQGFGQLLYTPAYLERFFADIVTAARAAFGERFVLVRKIKRALASHHLDEPVLGGLDAPLVAREPDDSLWRVLEDVDVVLCMPFTSVAYVADVFGIPAAYYDPGATAEASTLGGGAALLCGPDALAAWLRNPGRPGGGQAMRGDRAIEAGKTLLAAAGDGCRAPRQFDFGTRLERNVIHT